MAYIILVEFIIASGFIVFLTGIKASFKTKKIIFLALSFGACAFLMACRGENVGIDTISYKGVFETVSAQSWTEIFNGYYASGIEIGYRLFMKAISSLGGSYFVFQIVVSVIYCFGMAKFYYDNMGDPFTAVLLFLGTGMFLYAFNITRQLFAIMLTANAFTCLKNRRPYSAFALFLLAITIHLIALMFLIVAFIYFFRNNKTVLSFITVMLVVFALFYKEFLYLATLIVPRYADYLKYIGQGQDAGFVIILWMIIAAFSLYVLFDKKKFYEIGGFTAVQRVCALYSLAYFILCALSTSVRYMDRVGYFFVPFVPVLFETVGKSITKHRIKEIYFFGLNICFVIYFLISSGGAPYKFFF